jgi:hypothetical protein
MRAGTKKILSRVKRWPVEDQDELARLALAIESRRRTGARVRKPQQANDRHPGEDCSDVTKAAATGAEAGLAGEAASIPDLGGEGFETPGAAILSGTEALVADTLAEADDDEDVAAMRSRFASLCAGYSAFRSG